MKAPRSHPPLVILMDLLMLLMVMLIVVSQKDVYEITFAANHLPQSGARLVFRDQSGARFAQSEDAGWTPTGGEGWSGAVYVGCPFCAELSEPGGMRGTFEVALTGGTAQMLRDIVFDQCAARQKCRPLRVVVGENGDVSLQGGPGNEK
ncbi:MAG: hypothetical protein KDJ37_01905 [Hyphomicrobiaceae bacterium]|nr:hypothetical protein [Hyphomicrobiaceae bacterium]